MYTPMFMCENPTSVCTCTFTHTFTWLTVHAFVDVDVHYCDYAYT